MSPENTHKLMRIYMEGLILGVTTMYMLFCFFNPIHPIRNSLKKQKSMHIVLTRLLLKPPYKVP